jgi:hypothetical protein
MRVASRVVIALSGLAMLACSTALAQEFYPAGDGSGTNNTDLLRDPMMACENCADAAPHEWDAPPFRLDWSVSLRGAYVQDNDGSHFEAITAPSATFTHDFLRGTYSINGSAEVSKSTEEELRLNSLKLGTTGSYQVNEVLGLNGSANFTLSTPAASSTGYPTDTVSASQEISGDAEGSATYDWGRLVTTARGSVARSVYGPTTLGNGTQIDNSANNNWQFGSGLRIGYKVTLILTAFVDGSVGYQAYDFESPSYGVKLDGADYAVRGGLSSKWNEVLEAEASVGLGLRRFTYGVADDIVSHLYDASITFRPDETLTLRGALATTVGAPGANASGAARIEYAATGDVTYRVNPWVTLRGSAAYRYAIFSDSTTVETGYSVGAGADYLVNENISVSGDYRYGATTTAPANTTEAEHRVTLGVTVKR